MDTSPAGFAVRTDALTRPVSAAERRSVARPSASRSPRSWVATVGGWLAVGVVLVIVCFYLVGGDLELLPIVGALMLACIGYVVVAGIRSRRRRADADVRLRALAAENGLEVASDVRDPDTPGSLFGEGLERRLEHRIRQVAPLPVEVGRFRATAHAEERSRPIQADYIVVHDADAARRWASPSTPEPMDRPGPPLPTVAGVRTLTALPVLRIEGLPAPLRVEAVGDDVVLYSDQPFDLSAPATWQSLSEAVTRVRS